MSVERQPNRCARCGTGRGEIAWSDAAQASLCRGCYCVLPTATYHPPATPPVRLPGPKRHKPSDRERLYRLVLAAFQSAGQIACGSEWAVGGLGDPRAPLTGYCPVCYVGLVSVQIVDADPPFLRLDGCSAGCTPEQIARSI